MDWRQTLQFEKKGIPEQNPFFSNHPSDSEINAKIGAAMLAHVAVTHFLPARARPYWQMFWIGVEAGAVAHNARVGITLNF